MSFSYEQIVEDQIKKVLHLKVINNVVDSGENKRPRRRSSSGRLETQDVDCRRSGVISVSVDVNAENQKEDIIKTHPKSKEEEELIRNAIQENEFLSSILSEKRLQKVIECMYSERVSEGEILIKEGVIGPNLFISCKGTYQVTIGDNTLHVFDDVRVFGELAILYSAKRHVTVKSLENGSVWVLDCPTFKRLIIKTAIEEQEEMVSFLINVPQLNTAAPEKLYQVANLLQSEFFSTDTRIVSQGEIGDKFYIIRAGSVTVEKDEETVAKLFKGQYFGELALLKDEFRQATVIADTPGAECLTLTRKQFIDHFGDIDDFIKLKMDLNTQIEKIEFTSFKLEDLQVLQTLGLGAYGRVKLVQHVNHKNLVFALKSSRKVDISRKSQQNQVYNEKHLHMSCDSVFITRMYRTFQDSKCLYFLLEACLGGDLWNLLHKQKLKRFSDDDARFYSGCILEALSYLHERGILYRDLKPENVIVHHNGYLKLADFGFAKQIDEKEKTFSFVGTAEYVAPEIIQNKGYNKAVDYWSFGVFVYELLVGKTPFKSNDPGHLLTYKTIMRGIDCVLFPHFINNKAKSLIRKLCTHNPSERLGCLKSGVEAIRNHGWYSTFQWQKLANMEMEPPYKPHLLNNTDTRNFDKFPDEKDIPEDDFSEWANEF